MFHPHDPVIEVNPDRYHLASQQQ